MDNYDCNSSFPTRFRALLEAKIETPANRSEITRKEFAEKVLYCSRQTISRYAEGKTPPNILDLQAIAKYYQVSCDWLLGIDTCVTKDIKEISSIYGLNEYALLKLKKLAYNPFTEQGKYMGGSVPVIELINYLLNEDSENGVLIAISNYLTSDTLYTIDGYDLQSINDNDEAYKLKEKVHEVDNTLLDTSLFFDIQVELKLLKDKPHPVTHYK